MKFEIAARAIVGKGSSQQDAWRVVDARGKSLGAEAQGRSVVAGDRTLVIVADGVGGYAGGDVASNLASDTFVRVFTKARRAVPDRLSGALAAANDAIASEQREQPAKKDMSTTFIGLFLNGNEMTFVNVGDSLLLRYRDEEIHRVNLDHSYFEVLDRRVLGSEDPQLWAGAINDPQRRAITLALSGEALERLDYRHAPQIASRPLLPGDILIVASDGIETLELVQIQNFVRQLAPQGVSVIADALIRAVQGIAPNKPRDPGDNTTIVVVQTLDGSPPARAFTPSAMAETILGDRKRLGLFVGALAVLIGVVFSVLALRGGREERVTAPKPPAVTRVDPSPSSPISTPVPPSPPPQTIVPLASPPATPDPEPPAPSSPRQQTQTPPSAPGQSIPPPLPNASSPPDPPSQPSQPGRMPAQQPERPSSSTDRPLPRPRAKGPEPFDR